MKTFIYTISKTIINRTYGGSEQIADIYRIKNNQPIKIGQTRWCTRGYMGEVGEINAYLLRNKIIPNSWSMREVNNHNGVKVEELDEYYNPNNIKYRIKEV